MAGCVRYRPPTENIFITPTVLRPVMVPRVTLGSCRFPRTEARRRRLFSGVTPLWWAVTDTGILFVTREAEHDALDRFDFRGKSSAPGSFLFASRPSVRR